MEKLLNVENDWDGEVDCPEVMGPPCLISEEEVAAAIKGLQMGKAAGPTGVVNEMMKAPNDTAYKRWSCHSGFKLLCKLCRTSPPPAMGARFTVFWACRPCGPAGWLALLLTKAGDVETNPGPTTLNKKVWICDICHKQIHVRKQISIRCNRIEQWVHLRCAGIRQAQYTDTWTCHLHR